MTKLGSTVETPHGRGKVTAEEVFRTCERWGVELENNPFNYPIAFYFKREVTEVGKC